jgi:oligosaccharide repeat unit polymerase
MNYFIILLYIITLLWVRFIEKSWWTPSSFLLLLYSFLVLLTPISQYTTALGLLVLFTLLLSFNFGSFLVSVSYNHKQKTIISLQDKTIIKTITRVYLLCIILSFLGLITLINALNINFSDFFLLEGFIKISHNSAVARYQENFQTPFISNILFAFGYFAAFLAGFFKKELGFKTFLVFIIFLLYTLIYSTKAAFLLPLIFFISSYFIRNLLDNGRIKIKIKNVLTVFVLVVFIMIIASFFRYSGKLNFKEFIDHIAVYFIGNITPFTDWIENRYNGNHMYLGEYTLRGLFVLLDIKEPRAGVYDHFVPIINGESSNIHTAFRGLIEDYTLIATYFILFIIGIMSKILYFKIIECHLIYIAFILPIYSFIMWSPVYSLFAYNSLILAHLLLIPLFLYLNTKRNKICVK